MSCTLEAIHISDAFDLTRFLAEEAVERHYADFPESVRTIVQHCLLDTTGAALAGAREESVLPLRDELALQGGTPEASVFGESAPLPALSAALINGTCAHALDYDDVNFHMSGHPSAAIFPALWALGERLNSCWKDVVTAYVAGHEAGCRIGRLLAPSHYALGFHTTGTVGTLATAVACARLLDLDIDRTAAALSIASAQAAGLRVMDGTACKPLSTGRAAYNGLFAALLAARNFSTHPQALTAPAGFAVTHSHDFNVMEALESEPKDGYYLHDNVFKYHAACYLTHPIIDTLLAMLRDERVDASEIAKVQINASPELEAVCGITTPKDGTELKFSTSGVAALVLCGQDTTRLSSFRSEILRDAAFKQQHDKIRVAYNPSLEKGVAEVHLELHNGGSLVARTDVHPGSRDLAQCNTALIRKFRGLLEDTHQAEHAEALLALYEALSPDTAITDWLRTATRRSADVL